MANQVLVLRTVATVYNYDYVFDFIFYQNGVIEVKMSASGYIFGAFYNSNMDPYAYPLHEDFTSGTHDHLINYKVDLDVGGRGNSYETIEIGIENITERWFPNRQRVQKVLKRDVKKTEMDASYKFDFDHLMYLNFFNEKKNGCEKRIPHPAGQHVEAVVPRRLDDHTNVELIHLSNGYHQVQRE